VAGKLRTASVVILTVVGALVLVASLGSAGLAYFGDYPIAGVQIREIAGDREVVLTGLRGVRGTSAAWGAAWAVLMLAIVLGPYRKGDVASWWGILVSTLAAAVVVALRVVVLGTSLGTGGPLLLVLLVMIGLLLDVRRVAGASPAPPPA
jgi:hypothetical protein